MSRFYDLFAALVVGFLDSKLSLTYAQINECIKACVDVYDKNVATSNKEFGEACCDALVLEKAKRICLSDVSTYEMTLLYHPKYDYGSLAFYGACIYHARFDIARILWERRCSSDLSIKVVFEAAKEKKRADVLEFLDTLSDV